MENASYVALSRQGALRRQMDLVANNLANMNTTGFKAETMMFVEHLVKSRGTDRIAPEGINFVRDIAQIRNIADGDVKTTGNPLDVAIHGEGFFVIETDIGNRYTRNGRFSLDNEGQLVNQLGLPVLSDADTPFFFAPDDTNIEIATDGTISTENGVIGKLKIVRFENQQEMEKNPGGLLSTDAQPEDIDSPNLIQTSLEGSNVNPILELTKMIETQRAYDSVRNFINKEDQRQKKMINILGQG